MSGRGRGRGNWRYQNRRGNRGNSWLDRTKSMEPGSSKDDGSESETHPRNLRGKAIGLFYRNRQKKLTEGEKAEKKKREYVLNLKVPNVVAQKLKADLEVITKLENKLLKVKKENSVDVEKNIDNENKSDELIFKKPRLPDDACSNPVPNTSSDPDFICVKTEDLSDYGNDSRQLSLRGAGDFKYGYEDIITGSFDQKLDECLSHKIKINESSNEINKLNEDLKNGYSKMLKDAKYNKHLEFRKQLPTYKKRKELLEIINDNQVVVISGETGCGKSTQVPQLILDDAIVNSKGGNVKILVTQPRRIAALSLAQRVAQERAEKLGNSVGYVMRLERVDCRERGSITFCTTGVLLVDLEVDQGLTKYSHIILDEVHERDTHIDLAMCMLKKVLKKREDLKLILMSATIDSDKLSAYYDNCPMMHIEGLAYPVEDVYLEDIIPMIDYEFTEPVNDRNFKPKRWHKYVNKKSRFSMSEKAIQYRAEIGPWLESLKESGKIDKKTYEILLDFRIDDINLEMILQLLIELSNRPPGAILIFLPGIGEISKLIRLMSDSRAFPPHKFEIYPLHSKLPTMEQHKIFERPPDHIRKIIIATNIAETSITIDDIVYVVDCGRIKYTGLNVESNITTLQSQWISTANLRQRRGRAGRCQPGICFHMLTSFRASTLADRILPELQRSNLLEPVLQVKRLRLGLAEKALQLVPDPPDLSTVKRAVTHLQQCGALNDAETLTPLGWHLARLPVHPAAGKLLILGTLLGCLNRAASVAAVWSFKDPFLMVIGQESQVEEAKKELALGEPSDHVAMSEAIIQWESRPVRERRNYAFNNYLSHKNLELLSDMKAQLGENLKQMGFLTSANVRSSWENRNANNLSVFKAIVAAALYPNIGSVRWFRLNKINPRIKVQTPEDGGIKLHPSSVMAVKHRHAPVRSTCNNPGANWVVYWLKQRSSDLFLIDVTLVHTLPLLFFGELNIIENEEEKEEDKDHCLMSVSTYKVSCDKEQAGLLIKLRKLLDDVLASRITADSNYPTTKSNVEEYVLRAVIDIITAEDEGVDYYESDNYDDSNSECESTN